MGLTAFPPGTKLSVFKREVFEIGPPSVKPEGKPLATAEAPKDGSGADFKGLDSGELYWAHAEVDGQDRYVAFTG